ncbi:MAG: SGNH/GDSL hydrolase family protein, partial [Jatrophihabitantaceae bacterium]
AWQLSNQRALAGSGPLWVALGDSLSQGIGASAYDRGWVGQLAGQLREQGRIERVVNLAISGGRARDVIERQLPELARLTASVGPPELITLLIGSNDLIRRKYRMAALADFELLLAQLPAGAMVASLPNPTATASALNRSLQRAVTERELLLVELRQPRTTSWRGKLAADHFHPSDLGYAGIAGVFADALGVYRWGLISAARRRCHRRLDPDGWPDRSG